MAEQYTNSQEWLRRAKSNLAIAKMGRISDEILFEDLCFDAQQAAERVVNWAERTIREIEDGMTA